MHEVKNILRILKATKVALGKGDSAKLKDLSNQTINTASLTQDLDNVSVAVIVYSLSKIIERADYRNLNGWEKFYGVIVNSLDQSISDLQNGDFEKFRKDFGMIRKTIGKLSGKLRSYIQDVFRRAEINKASRIHEHGISLEQTANLLGITQYELADYVGQTDVSDSKENKTFDVQERVKLALEVLG